MKRKILTISLIVGISILLWVFVSFSGEFSITLNLPIEITELPENSAISSISSNEVTINLKGTGWQLAQHTFGRNQKFYLEGPQKLGVQNLSPLSALNANDWLSSTLQLTKIIPEEISVEVEKNIIKKVKVIPNLDLSYKPNYDLVSKISVLPDSVLISGPQSLINKISFIKTVNDSYSNLERKISTKLKLQKQKFILLEHDECNVQFDVQKIVDKTFDKIKVVTRNVPPRYDVVLSPSTVKIIIRGGINLLSKLKNTDIKAYVNFSQAINDTSGAVEPKIELPDFTNIIDQNPQNIDYIIKKY